MLCKYHIRQVPINWTAAFVLNMSCSGLVSLEELKEIIKYSITCPEQLKKEREKADKGMNLNYGF
jgi:hypothetical protein